MLPPSVLTSTRTTGARPDQARSDSTTGPDVALPRHEVRPAGRREQRPGPDAGHAGSLRPRTPAGKRPPSQIWLSSMLDHGGQGRFTIRHPRKRRLEFRMTVTPIRDGKRRPVRTPLVWLAGAMLAAVLG